MRRGWVLLLLLASACGMAPTAPSAIRVVATPHPASHAEVSIDLTQEVAETPQGKSLLPKSVASKLPQAQAADVAVAPAAPLPPAVAAAPLAAPAPANLSAFTTLGSWIDVFDYTNDPKTLVPLVKAIAGHGAKTLYLESGRMSASTDIQFPKALGAGLDEAKARGMRVIAWYPPGLDDVARDVRRSIAAVKFRSPRGNAFDGFGADIEYTSAVPDHTERSKRAVEYSNRLRLAVGKSYPMAAIVIPPTSLELNKTRWPGFPWSSIAKSYQLFQVMNYWTAHGKNAATAADLTKKNIAKTRALTGKPVHIIGGLGADSDRSQVAAYVKACRDGGALGGGLYDFTTTRSDVWGELAKLNG